MTSVQKESNSGKQNYTEKKGSDKVAELIKRCVGIIVFFMIGIILFAAIQYILIPKRFSYVKSYDAGKLKSYYTEENNSIDVLICSTSHASKGILPMEIYEKYGIKSYNLSTSIQPIEATYYLLSETLNNQNLKVFVYDVSNLYMSSSEKNYWLYVLDEMHLGKNKLALAREYKRSANNCDETMEELLIPLLRYHTRWNELNKQDFAAFLSNKHYYGKGGQINSIVNGAEVSVEQMNRIESELEQNTEQLEYIYDNGEFSQQLESDITYDVEIPTKNIEWLKKIKTLCDENEVQFLAVKVPTIYLPQSYRSAWTAEKYHAVRQLCDEHGIVYYDMLYEADVNIDWSKDTTDKGQHLNLYGAQKVSADLGRYLQEHYELPQKYMERWDEDLLSYREVREIAELQLERDFVSYVNMLAKRYKDKMIFICASGDMAGGVTEEDINALRGLGLQADFSAAFQKSYIAFIENGDIAYEASSNRQLRYQGTCSQSGKVYFLYSSGWWTGAGVSIKLEDVEFANKGEGINIVVYDDEKDLVIDSVCFDTSTEEHTVLRNNVKINSFETAFERYMTESKNK